MRRVLTAILSILFLAVSFLLASAVVYIVRSEVAPALAAGSPDIETDSVILNMTWRGNQIYVLLAVYTVLALGLAFGSFIMARRAVRGRRKREADSRPAP